MSGEKIKQKFLKDTSIICPNFKPSWTKIFKITHATPFFSTDYYNLPIKISDKIYLTGIYKEHPATRTMNTAFKSGLKTADYILSNG